MIIENENENVIWQSCCMKVDRNMVIFLSHHFIGLLVIIFSMFKLNQNLSCESQNAYLSLLTFICGILLPSPSLRK
jgi:hypothetical protein